MTGKPKEARQWFLPSIVIANIWIMSASAVVRSFERYTGVTPWFDLFAFTMVSGYSAVLIWRGR